MPIKLHASLWTEGYSKRSVQVVGWSRGKPWFIFIVWCIAQCKVLTNSVKIQLVTLPTEKVPSPFLPHPNRWCVLSWGQVYLCIHIHMCLDLQMVSPSQPASQQAECEAAKLAGRYTSQPSGICNPYFTRQLISSTARHLVWMTIMIWQFWTQVLLFYRDAYRMLWN